MGSAKRAVRYLIRKKSKTVILFLVLLISEAMILSTGIILKASNEAKSELQKKQRQKYWQELWKITTRSQRRI